MIVTRPLLTIFSLVTCYNPWFLQRGSIFCNAAVLCSCQWPKGSWQSIYDSMDSRVTVTLLPTSPTTGTILKGPITLNMLPTIMWRDYIPYLKLGKRLLEHCLGEWIRDHRHDHLFRNVVRLPESSTVKEAVDLLHKDFFHPTFSPRTLARNYFKVLSDDDESTRILDTLSITSHYINMAISKTAHDAIASAHEVIAIEFGILHTVRSMDYTHEPEYVETLKRFDVWLTLFTRHIRLVEDTVLHDDSEIGLIEEFRKADAGDVVIFDVDWTAVTCDASSALKFAPIHIWNSSTSLTKLDECINDILRRHPGFFALAFPMSENPMRLVSTYSVLVAPLIS